MDRNREARRVAMTTPTGLPRRRHRTGSPRGSPEHDGAYELQESSRFRERTGKKDRDRDNERSDRDRWSRSKRRMGEKHMNGSNREDGVGDSSEVEEEDEERDDTPTRLIHPNPASIPPSASPSSTLTSHRKSYPPTWKASDEMIGVSIPRKARSASTKRSYDCWTSAGSSPPVASSGVVSPSAASVSPTSSSLSVKKKIANGSNQRPPKSTKSPSTIQEDIEIEVAEVLYGLMRQSQGPSQPEVMPNDSGVYGSREVDTSTENFKSRETSRVLNSSSSAPPPFSDTSPKRKKPRLVNQHEENTEVVASDGSPIPTAPKSEADLQAKPEIHLPKLENISDLPAENGGVQSALLPATGALSSVEKRSTAADQLLGTDLVTKEKIKEVSSQEKETLNAAVNCTSIKQITTATGDKESCREEKFEIDLMAPPPQSRSSPEGGRDMNYHHEPMAVDGEAVCGPPMLFKVELFLKPSEVEKVELKNTGAHPGETHKPNFKGDTNLHCDSKLGQQLQNHPPLLSLKPSRNDTSADKTALTSFLPPLSMPVPAGWPIGVPPIGYVAPQQGVVVSVDGKPMAPTAIEPPRFHFTQPRPVRCASHGYIAKDICIHQKLLNTIWPANAGAAPLFGAPSSNLNVVPAGDLLATAVLRGDVNPDKGHVFAFLPGQQPSGKDKGVQPATNIIVEDGDQKNQFFQSLPHGGPSNMLHGPATFFYPLSQQQVAAASTCANSTKPLVMTTGPVSSSTVTATAQTAGQASPVTLSFSYPNVAGNETQYMAIMGNGAYPFPIPAHVGAAQAYRGAPAQVMPFYNGSYYPSPIVHPSQQQAPPPQQIHQKPSISTASSSSQKQPQNQLQRSQGSSANGITTNPAPPTFPTPKSRASEMGREGSPSTANSCLSRPPNMNVYGQNFTMPFNPANFALLTPPIPVPLTGATTGGAASSNHTEKKDQAPQAFALSFASSNGAMPAGFDKASKAHNQAMLQSLPESARNNYHIMTPAIAAQTAPQKMNYHGSEDRKSGASNVENDRKGTAARASASSVQSISFSRPDLVETSAATVSGNNVADTAARSSSLAPGSAHSSRSNTNSNSAVSNSHQQKQPYIHNSNSAVSNSHQQKQPFIHLQKQQQFAASATQNKAPVASNGRVYADHFSSASATGAKFTNAASAPNVQSSKTQSHWKNPGRTTTQVGLPSMSTSITASMKTLGQQLVRPQQGQTHISFGGNPKASTTLQVQQGSPSPSMMVGSPSASSVFKGHNGSPRMTTPTSVGGKPVQATSVTTQQGKDSPAVASQNQKSFGNPHMPASSSKPQSQQQPQQILQQPQLSKQSIQQTQMFFNASYMQTYSTAPSAGGGFQLQRHHQPKQQQQQQSSKSQGGPTITVSSGMHLNSTLPNGSTNDPVKAIAAASNIKGGAQSQSNLHAGQTSGGTPMVVSSGFTYVHAVPTAAVQVKPAEQKQPAA